MAPKELYAPKIRVTLDAEEDYALLCSVFDCLYSKNEYFIGTLSGGLNLFNIETEEFTHLKNAFSELGSPILSVHLSNLENAWLATWGNGLLNYNRKNNTIKSYSYKARKSKIS